MSSIGGWLTPTRNPDYDPEGNREAFMAANDALGKVALEAWELADFAHCDMPDEYLGYAERFVEQWQHEIVTANELSSLLVREVVRRCHSENQIAFG